MSDVNLPENEDHVQIINQIKRKSLDNKEKLSKTLLASCIASLATFGFGYNLGYASPVQSKIDKKFIDDGVLTDEEFSLFNSLVCLGAIVGSFVGSYFLDQYGRKFTILSTTFFYTLGWCLIAAAQNPAMFFIGRLICGTGVGISSLCVSVYISEIASPKYRGGLCSLQQLSVTIGIFIAYLIGTEITWRWAAVFPIFVTCIMTVGMFFMPESPRYDLARGQSHTALRNLQWLRGSHYDAADEIREIQENMDSASGEKIKLADFTTPALYRPLVIGALAMVFQQFCGINAIITYCDSIFKSASVHNSSLISIIVSLIQIVFTLIACLIVDKSGRRLLLMVGGFCMFVVLFLLGVYYDITIFDDKSDGQIDIFHRRTVPVSEISWLAITCVIVFIIMFSLGWGPIPWMLMSELFPPKARDVAGAFVNVVNWLSAFLIMKLFPQMKDTFKDQGTFWFYAGFSLLSFLFTLFFVPETKGKTLEEIERYFIRKPI